MKKEKVYKQRLEKLAKHLEVDKLGLDRFYFGEVCSRDSCGTVGCAMGELPFAFPRSFFFNGISPCLKSLAKSSYYLLHRRSVEKFFGLNDREVEHLFYPRGQRLTEFGGEILGNDASKEAVAANIRAFIEKVS